jgi:heme-degrading monooxygenase HmoA
MMYARITIIHVPPDRIDEGVKLYRKSVIPDAKKQKGYCGDLLLVDPKTGKGNSITFWESEKAAIATDENLFYQEQLVKFLTFFSAPPIREGYEVRINTFEDLPKKKSTKKAKS